MENLFLVRATFSAIFAIIAVVLVWLVASEWQESSADAKSYSVVFIALCATLSVGFYFM